MGPLYSFSGSQIGNADGDGRAAVRCVWRPFLFRVGLSEESVVVKEKGCGGVFVFLVLELQGRRSMRKEPLLSIV